MTLPLLLRLLFFTAVAAAAPAVAASAAPTDVALSLLSITGKRSM